MRERELKVHCKVWENFPCIPVIQECPWNKTEIKKNNSEPDNEFDNEESND